MTIAPGGVRVPFTYEAYRALPDDGRRYEVIDGELYVSPAPTTFHQKLSARLLYALMQQLEDAGIAEVFHAPCDLLLANTTVVQPDLLVVARARRGTITKRAIEAAPDVVVEILSPSTRDRDEALKRAVYARFGAREYWLVDPDAATVEVLVLERDGYRTHARFDRSGTLRSTVFAGIAIPLEPLFRPI